MVKKKIYIVAEAGVNHNGDIKLAKEMIDVAASAGADAVKFQSFCSEKVVTRYAGKADYQKKQLKQEAESQLKMLKVLEVGRESHFELQDHCQKENIDFMSTAFDRESLHFLVQEIGVKKLKIASGEITNGPFLMEHARTGCDLVLSTGMSNLAEIERSLEVIAFGMMHPTDEKISEDAFKETYHTLEAQKMLKERVTLLHCTSEYPAPNNEVNLKAIQTIQEAFQLSTGFSDHSSGIAIPTASAAFGVTFIEKHFTLSRSFEGPDHQASLEPNELHEMVKAIRIVEEAIGDGRKTASPSERKNKIFGRRSLIAAKEIFRGERFSSDNTTAKRPGNGISPMEYWSILGQKSNRDYEVDELIDKI